MALYFTRLSILHTLGNNFSSKYATFYGFDYLESESEHLYPLGEDGKTLGLQAEVLLLANGDQAGEHPSLARAHVPTELAEVNCACVIEHGVSVDVGPGPLDQEVNILRKADNI